jgi:hypothetical protein
MSRRSGIAPELISTAERLSELGRILASGVLRMRQQSSSFSDNKGDSPLAFLPTKSGGVQRAEARVGGQ